MSDSKSNEVERTLSPQKPARPWMALGVAASLLISCTLLIWAFSLPFPRLSASARPAAAQEDSSITARQTRSESEEIREAAMIQHRDFLYLLKKQKQIRLQQELPGREESQERWGRRSEEMKGKIAELTEAIKDVDAPEGSMLWQNREHLIKTVADSAE